MTGGGFKALVWLMLTGRRNQLRRQLVRLKKPGYAIASIFGIGYLVSVLLVFKGPQNREAFFHPGLIAPLVPLMIMMFVASWWIWGGHQTALALTPGETAMLVPAPLTRRQLIQFKLMQAQFGLIVLALIVSSVFDIKNLGWVLRFIAFWVLFTTLSFHQVAASLVHAGAFGQGGPGLKRFAVPAVLALMVLIVVAMCFSGVTQQALSGDVKNALSLLITNLGQPLPQLVMFPITAILNPLRADNFSAWLTAMPAAVLVLVLHYLWLLRSDHAFEEAAAEAGQRRVKAMEALRGGRILQNSHTMKIPAWRRRFRLKPDGRPEVAIIWKNLLLFFGMLRPRLIIMLTSGLFILVALATYFVDFKFALTISGVALLSVFFMLTLFGPIFFRADLRVDLESFELLRTFPLNGQRLVAAEILASTFSLFLIQAYLIVLMLIAMVLGPAFPRSAITAATAVAILIMLVPFNAIFSAIQNGVALIWPAWSQFGTDISSGLENTGKMMVIMLVTMFATGIALILPALCGLLAYAAYPDEGVLAVIVAAIGADIGGILEFYLFTLWLGRLYEKLDPVEVGLVN